MSEAKTLPSAARAAMEQLNAEAAGLHIWLRTQANAPAQRPWFRDGGLEEGGQLAEGRVGANQMKAAAHHWRWHEIGPYLDRIGDIARNADVSPIEFADRQQFLLVNPGLGGRVQAAGTVRGAVSVDNPRARRAGHWARYERRFPLPRRRDPGRARRAARRSRRSP